MKCTGQSCAPHTMLMNAQGRSLRDDRDKIRFGTRRAACEEPYSSRPSVWLNRRPYMLLMRYDQRNLLRLLYSNAPSTVWATLHHCEGATEENEDHGIEAIKVRTSQNYGLRISTDLMAYSHTSLLLGQ